MFFGSRLAMKSVAAAEITALAAWRALGGGDRIGGFVFNETEIRIVRPQRSKSSVMQLLHEVQRLNQALSVLEQVGSITLNDVLRQASPVAPHDALVVIVSDLDGADATTQQLVTQLAAHNDVVCIVVYDPLGASLTGATGMLAQDRGQIWFIPSGRAFAEQFQNAFQRLLDQWREIFRALRVPILPISAALSVPKQVRQLFGQGAKVQ
jgi:uncharacterized protein (DUF58 family)